MRTFVPEEEDKVYMQRNKINERIERKIVKAMENKTFFDIGSENTNVTYIHEPLGIYVP